MTLFVYVTDQCREDAVSHGLQTEVDRFRDSVESTQSTSRFDPFPPPYLVKKKMGGRQGRLIAEYRQVGEHAVIVFLAILIRGHRAYEDEFARDPKGYGDQHFSKLVDTQTLEAFVSNRTQIEQEPPKPVPSDADYGLLYGAFVHHTNSSEEDLVCETKLWVDAVSQDRVAKQLNLFCAACLAALSKPPGLHFVPIESKQGWGVWVLRGEGRLLLITPSTDTTVKDAERQAEALAKSLDGKSASEVLQASRRAYPAVVLIDDDLWIDLQADAHANMALSPEESEVLDSARHGKNPFPLFINGRAGSGKSTILQYLYADLLFYYLSKPESRPMAPPIYFTANGELLRVARAFVERMLRNEANFAQQDGATLVEENGDILDQAFREFQPHLLSLVPTDVRISKFAMAARVDYTRFRRMWTERFAREPRALNDYGPDLSWHVIRSYIKGMSSETLLEPEDYAQLPENQLTVTQETFKQVYDHVWTGWYQRVMEDEGLWDDQDLTRYILDNELAQRIYPAVFCDEAQDFTRIELELLLRINLFSNRTLGPQDISHVPFVFAGDQFQTLNPTGFRWDAIKAVFVEKFIYELDPSRRSGLTDLNYRELKYNYRSTQKIVRFSNQVQALRAALFQLPDIRPQIPWTNEQRTFPVVWFRANDAAFWKSFRGQPNFVVIVPCNEGEESNFVQGDPVLREHIRIEDGVPTNVLSASRAKGREYPAVLVYGFGARAETDIMKTLDEPNASKPDRSLPIQYFINRLYVAVSRPKIRLVVVDTEDGFSRLWACSRDDTFEQRVLSRIRNGREVWADEIEGMTVGNVEAFDKAVATDPLENARSFEQDGLARSDPFLLKQAAQAYRSGGDEAKARECRARALELEGQLLEAGNAYFEAGFATPDGVRCLWRAGRPGWLRLCDQNQQHRQIETEIEFQWARMATHSSGGPEAVVDLVDRFARRLDDSSFAEGCIGHALWRDAMEAVLAPMFDKGGQPTQIDQLRRLVPSIDKIRGKGIKLPARFAGHIFNLGQRFHEAIAYWDESGDTRHPEYLRAKAAIEPYPQRVATLYRLGLLGEVLNSYNASPDTPLTLEQAVAVADALLSVNRKADAYEVAWQAGSIAAMLRVSLASYQAKNHAQARTALHSAFMLLVQQAQWEALAPFVKSLQFEPTPEWKDQQVKEWVNSEVGDLQNLLVRALARSQKLVDAAPHLQRQICDFLRGYLRIKDGTWKSHVTIQEAGAAFERGGRFTDSIAYYEAVLKDKPQAAEKNFARDRWLMCKQRQLDYEQTLRNSKRVDTVERELRASMRDAGIRSLEDIPAYPELPPLSKLDFESHDIRDDNDESANKGESSAEQQTVAPTPDFSPSALAEHVSVNIGGFEIAFSRKNSRCNITHTETSQTASVKLKEKRCLSDDVEFSEVSAGQWECPAWGLSVKFLVDTNHPITLSLQQLGVLIHFAS